MCLQYSSFFIIISALRRYFSHILLCSIYSLSFIKKIKRTDFECVESVISSVLKLFITFIVIKIRICWLQFSNWTLIFELRNFIERVIARWNNVVSTSDRHANFIISKKKSAVFYSFLTEFDILFLFFKFLFRARFFLTNAV